ncbi:MAG: DUF2891 family protein [Alphaproteobacteria bacterium]
MAQGFAAQISFCSARQDTSHPVFHGCIDWHSAAHGLWALTAYERMTGDKRYAAQVDGALQAQLLAQELEYLHANPDFEMPYGRAWFLRLAVEHQQLRGDGKLTALGAEAAASLRKYYTDAPPNPLLDRYDNPSWALVNAALCALYAGQGSRGVRRHDGAEEFPRAKVPRWKMSASVLSRSARRGRGSYPKRCRRRNSARGTPNGIRGIETLEPVRDFPSAHDYGRNFSRAWGLYHLAEALGDGRLRKSYAAHVEAGFSPANQWRGEYEVNGHWVAQFGMQAIAPLFGRDPIQP